MTRFTLAILALALSACDSGKDAVGTEGTAQDFPVNEPLATAFTAQGLPSDVARFLAAAKLDTVRVDANTFVYKQTFPNGATRDITMKLMPGRAYTPTAEESAKVAKGGPALYDFKYASVKQADGSTRMELDYFVPNAGIPPALLSQLGSSALSTEDLRRIALPRASAAARNSSAGGGSDGAGVAWVEVGKTGADVGIGSLLDAAKDKGLPTGALSNIYALASAASAIGGALELAKQNGKWGLELDALERCARNPTNIVTKSDPNYTPGAVAKVQQARNELDEVNSARFLNQMNETGSGITPQTAAMSIGLKAGFAWSDQTLGDYSENTIMREARLAVVPCGDPVPKVDGNVTVTWHCNNPWGSQVDVTNTTVTSSVGWVWSPTFHEYLSQGSYEYQKVLTVTGGGKTCTYKETSKGSLEQGGALQIFTDPAAVQLFGYDYMASGELSAEVDWTDDCSGKSGKAPVTISWLPAISGLMGAGAGMAGEQVKPSCTGGEASGTEVTKWSFTVPPMD
ncbi:MAG: hypothetical protein JWP91_3854 [Fibrobacteres bacterium]|nr:hypothetical protein [Fibrobacterota bacterium]